MNKLLKHAEELLKGSPDLINSVFKNPEIAKLSAEDRIKINNAKIEIDKVFNDISQNKTVNLTKLNSIIDGLNSSR